MSVTPISAASGASKPARTRRPTATANFGSGRRESHDATAFYDRFVAPEISTDTQINPPGETDVIHVHDARDMAMVANDSVALVVTSPPYFAGKQYEESLGENGVPATYFEYLQLLHDVFAECKRVLEPGGRIAVNVANLGRRPYRSLAADVTEILQDLGLLLRGEVVWWKGRAAGGSCAWGTFQRPANPVLRDVTERVVIASKGRFDRALTPSQRLRTGLPSTATISREEFMEATTDLWEIAPERASRVGHPAPFPVELPQRLIDLYTYADDVVLDPFMGSGSTALAAVRTGRHYIGFDTDPNYVDLAEARIAEAREQVLADVGPRVAIPAGPAIAPAAPATADPTAASDDAGSLDVLADQLAEACRRGRQTREVAGILIAGCGFTDLTAEVKPKATGVTVDFTARDQHGTTWAFLVSGGFTATRTGLRRTDTLWRMIGQAAVVHDATGLPVVLLSTDVPPRSTAGAQALRAATGPDRPVAAALEVLSPEHAAILEGFARLGPPTA